MISMLGEFQPLGVGASRPDVRAPAEGGPQAQQAQQQPMSREGGAQAGACQGAQALRAAAADVQVLPAPGFWSNTTALRGRVHDGSAAAGP